MRATSCSDSVMKTSSRQSRQDTETHKKNREASLICYKCWQKGHIKNKCNQKVWCGDCRSNWHAESLCRRKGKEDGVRKIVEDKEEDIDNEDQSSKQAARGHQPTSRRKGSWWTPEQHFTLWMTLSSRVLTTHSSPISIQSSWQMGQSAAGWLNAEVRRWSTYWTQTDTSREHS